MATRNVTIRKFKSRFRFSRKHRPRLRGRARRRRFSPVLTWLLIIALVFAGFSIFETRMKPAIDTIAQTRARNLAVREINLAVAEKLAFGGAFDYNDLVEVDKSRDGNVEAIRTNIQLVNLLKSELMLLINERLWHIDTQPIAIPIGNLSRSQLLAGRGPRISINLLPAGDAEVEMLHNFTSAGINQTKHQILLDIRTNIEIIMPTGNTHVQVATQIPVAETIIVGTVPNTYMNIDGVAGLISGN
ncbi:MAG: sporulation protein YunB [Oscillospiraceae bacterium]|nr:sporulation protein YunB [Oscillospiraceae bacterium]